ncbi:bifunctional hydroxymethylpyrimidine kinase/phosphomethylpyrimidine kinase [Arthrobacter sp. 35W]|uniref:bifunctional hydroxymethylpyrimidine kinase/phosphomethylpyrimidine kinase n=1 Tax=Arthrobacter sp. 35W TaxID=1132441 RepID=UPI000429DE33|nr:bifunctional hydroxymethylpyrimidine kinase/phosphomethylpyrimidine kinase [Arthrobacter sp. 35W]
MASFVASAPSTSAFPALRPVPRVLSIAGSDPSGGAGIQADLKSIAANGGYGMAAITALTAQNTHGVAAVHVPPAEFLTAQLDCLSADVAIDAVKIGMLGQADVIDAVGAWLDAHRPAVVVLDPVMVATSGDSLLSPEAAAALRALVPKAHLVTPNLAELAILVDQPQAATWADAVDQGKLLAVDAGVLVLVKGGHLDALDCPDALVGPDGSVVEAILPRVATGNTHGTGCSLSAALATAQAQLGDWQQALHQAKGWLHDALAHADVMEVGTGNGPVNHFHRLWASAAPVGDEFSRSLWQETEEVRGEIFALDFITALGDGTLAEPHFAYYLAQDALYLNSYSRVLAKASALAPTEDEQRFWAKGAQQCLAVELDLHRTWLSKHPTSMMQGPVTKSYVDHLVAASAQGSYGELVAALLPCYWLYAEVGAVLHGQYIQGKDAGTAGHPYGSWLETYADEDFAEATRTAIGYTDSAARNGSAAERERMRAAFMDSARYERDFFDAPRLHA